MKFMDWLLFSLPISVNGADVGNGIRVFLPDIGMFMAGLGTWLLCRSLEKKRPVEEMAQYNQDFDAEEQVRLKWTGTSKYLALLCLYTWLKWFLVRCCIFIDSRIHFYSYISSGLIQRDFQKCFITYLYPSTNKAAHFTFTFTVPLADTFIEGWAEQLKVKSLAYEI